MAFSILLCGFDPPVFRHWLRHVLTRCCSALGIQSSILGGHCLPLGGSVVSLHGCNSV